MFKISVRDAIKTKIDEYRIAKDCRNYHAAQVAYEFVQFYYSQRNSGMVFLTKRNLQRQRKA